MGEKKSYVIYNTKQFSLKKHKNNYEIKNTITMRLDFPTSNYNDK